MRRDECSGAAGKTLPALTGELAELGRAVYTVILRNTDSTPRQT
jgi:hypothetical protein